MLYHVFSRGNEQRAVFRDDRDSAHFLELVGRFCERFEIEVWSYVLMGNHYHLVLKTRRANLSRAMHWLGVSYTVWHNLRHERAGHLFQGRFKSFTVEEEAYLEQLILYTHRNPLRAGLTDRLAAYRWSSYRCLAYGRGCVDWLPRAKVLGLFGGEASRFRRAVQRYSDEAGSFLEDLRFGVFLGSEEAFERFRDRVAPEPHREKPHSRRVAGHRSVAHAVPHYLPPLGLSAEDLAVLRRPRRGRELPARDILIYLLWQAGTFTLKEIGDYFHVGYTTIANARTRGAGLLGRNRKLARTLKLSNDK